MSVAENDRKLFVKVSCASRTLPGEMTDSSGKISDKRQKEMPDANDRKMLVKTQFNMSYIRQNV